MLLAKKSMTLSPCDASSGGSTRPPPDGLKVAKKDKESSFSFSFSSLVWDLRGEERGEVKEKRGEEGGVTSGCLFVRGEEEGEETKEKKEGEGVVREG